MTNYTITQDEHPSLRKMLACGQIDAALGYLRNLQPNTQKPLTDEQIIEIAQLAQSEEPGREGYVLRISFARAIERAHGVSNGNRAISNRLRRKYSAGFEAGTKPAPQQPAKTNWSELVQWWESGGGQWDVLQNIVTRMVNTAAPQAKPLTAVQIESVCVDVHLKRDFVTNLEKFVAIARAIEAAHNIGVKP